MNSRNGHLGSARVSRAGDGLRAVANFLIASRLEIAHSNLGFRMKEKSVAARRRNQHARRVRYPERIL
jgi:hypothetical protein